ncbi:MAG: NAD(P)/FAD-dependent oxidoreductase, partial [Clostridia bacterium]|nr:NAD(P)/FAD-dependent oxidoreductase [Clostridia bacterium]
MLRIAIIGAGASGLLAAHFAAEADRAEITVFEKNPVCGKKLRITGKGRCNVTTTTPVGEMEPMLPRGGKFLRTALYAFPPERCRAFFEEAGVPLKEERGGRVFPVSDRAADIVAALTKKATSSHNVTLKHEKVLSL